jgi:putative transposase
MARLPRLDLADHLHLMLQRGRDAQPIFVDDEDRRRYLAALIESSREFAVAVHAYALMDDQVLLLATPPEPASLGRFMQAVGRRYVKAFNRRHARRGPLWEGRYRATVVDPTSHLMACIRLVEQAPLRQSLAMRTQDWPWSSAAHHAGQRRDALVTEHAAYWQLGNTPFEREARHLRESGVMLTEAESQALLAAASHGWPVGSDAFLRALAHATDRPVRPRPRGRPRLAGSEFAGA